MPAILTPFLVFLFSLFQGSASNVVKVNVSQFESNKGQLCAALYNNENDFLKKPIQKKYTDIQNLTASIVFEDVEPGTYAVGVYHDENGNGKLDFNFVGIPNEPVAVSNNVRAGFGPPSYSDAKFTKDRDALVLRIDF